MDFDNRISQAQNTANASMDAYNKAASQADTAYNDFNTGLKDYGNTNYGNLLDAANQKYLNTEEMNNSRTAYQDARNAVGSLQATVNQLPDSIAGQYKSNGLMMNEAQRQRATQAAYNNYSRALDNASNTYSTASDMYDRDRNIGLQLALAEAGGNDANRLNQLNALQGAWSTLLGRQSQAYSANQGDRSLLANEYGARDTNLYQQQQMEFERWKEEQATARANAANAANYNLQKYLADRGDAQQKAQAEINKQILEQQNRAAYNQYRASQNAAINDQFNKSNSLFNNFLSPLQQSFGMTTSTQQAIDAANKARSGLLTYDQYVGAR